MELGLGLQWDLLADKYQLPLKQGTQFSSGLSNELVMPESVLNNSGAYHLGNKL